MPGLGWIGNAFTGMRFKRWSKSQKRRWRKMNYARLGYRSRNAMRSWNRGIRSGQIIN